MKKIINYILVLCLIIMPSIVSAHELSTGDIVHENGTTTIPIKLTLDSDLSSGQSLGFDCNAEGTSCNISYSGIDGVSSAGALIKDVKSGETITVAKAIVGNSTFSEINVSVSIRGMSASTSVSTYVKGKQALKTDSKFSAISTSQGKMYPEFSASTDTYTIYNLKDTIVSTSIKMTCDKCTVKAENYGSLEVSTGTGYVQVSKLAVGNNEVTLVSKSEDGSSTSTYHFTIIRGESSYNSSKLSTLSFGDYVLSPVFKKSVVEYELEVPYSVKDLTSIISANPEDSDADITVEGLSGLVVGENTVTIKIKSVNKDDETTYTIKVKRLTSEDIIVQKYKNNKITFLDAEGEEQTLSSDEFKTTYPTVWKSIEAGDIKFDKDGNVIGEEVSEEKEDKKDNKKTIIIIVILVIAVLIIGVAGYLLFRKKDPEKEKKKEEEKIKKKAEKKKRKEELKKLEAKYYNEDYDDEDEDEDEEEDNKDSNEITEDDKLSKAESESLIEDDYIFESTLIADDMDMEEEEEKEHKHRKDDVVDVDSALEDLMNTKTYDFSDELKNIDEDDEEDE